MRSLLESIFDDNVKSGWMFGDLFEFTQAVVPDPPTNRQTMGKNWTLDNLYNWRQIEKDSKVKRDDPDDSVVDGLVAMICKLKVTPKMTRDEFDELLKTFTKYYKAIVNATLRLRVNAKPRLFNCGSNSMETLGKKYTLDDIADKLEIGFCRVKLYFKKK